MSTTTSRSHFNNRRAMALRLADVLLAFPQTDAATVRALPAAGRRMVEQISGERREASDETWAMVAEIVERAMSQRAEMALRWIDSESFDPAKLAAVA